MSKIMESGNLKSKSFRPRIKFGISVVSTDGYEGVRVQTSWDGGSNWQDAHTEDFADGEHHKVFEVPRGVLCRINNPSNKSADGYVGYVGDGALVASIELDILD